MNDTHAFLSSLFLPYGSTAAHVELRCFAPPWAKADGRPPRAWHPATPVGLARAAADAVLWSERFDVYYGVLPRVKGGGRSEHLRCGAWLWCDLDAGAETVKEALALLTAAVSAGLPRPHVLVRSGGGAHAYWRLAEVVPCREPEEQNRLRTVLRRLVRVINAGLAAAKTGAGDPTRTGAHACPKATDAARILRLPGTFNHKIEGRSRPVQLLRLDEAAPAFPLLWWEAHLPPEPLPPRPIAPKDSARRWRAGGCSGARDDNALPPATIAKITAPTPDGGRHYAMVDVAVSARKRGLDEASVRDLAERVGVVSGVPMGEWQQQQHLDGIVAWTMRTVQPDPET